MRRKLTRTAAYIQIALALMTGCAPTQPFFIPKQNQLATYLDQALAIEYADVKVESLPEASQAVEPLGPANPEKEVWDLSLEDCISIALQNTKVFRVAQGANSQSGSVSALLLSAQPGQMPSVYDSAIVSSLTNTQPRQIDNNGNRVPFRGAIRSNQVGGVEDALSEFDAQFSSVFGYNTTDRPRNVGPGSPFNPQFFQGVDANYQSALSKKTATGGVVTLRTTTVYSSNNVAIGIGRAVPSDYTQTLEAQLTHPLMRGRGTMVNRIPVVLARINEDIALHDFESNVRNLVRDVEAAYWDLYLGYRAFETAQTSQFVATELWRVAKERANKGGPPEAEAQARALFHQFENAVLAARHGSTVAGSDPNGLEGREQILREKMGLAANDGRLIRPTDSPTSGHVSFDWNEVLAEGLVRNTELRRQKWAIKAIDMELISAKNQLLPQLDLTGIYRWVGVGDEWANSNRSGIRFPAAGASALEGLTSGDYQEVGARIEFTPGPIGLRQALAGVTSRKIALQKAHVELQEKEVALVNEMSKEWRLMNSNYEQIRTFLAQWQSNEDEVQIYLRKIETNVGVELPQLLDLLLRAEERRARAQFSYYSAITAYNKHMCNIHYWKGSLLDLNNIALQEGQWTGKAYWDAQELARQRAAGTYFDYGYTRPEVISNGTVATGGSTEGNVPVSAAAGSRNPSGVKGQGDSPNDKNSRPPFPKLEELDQDSGLPKTTGNNRGRNSRHIGSTSAVECDTNESLEWGDLGLAPVSASSSRAAGSADVKQAIASSAGQRSSPTASVQSGARSINSNSSPASTPAQGQAGAQWQPKGVRVQ